MQRYNRFSFLSVPLLLLSCEGGSCQWIFSEHLPVGCQSEPSHPWNGSKNLYVSNHPPPACSSYQDNHLNVLQLPPQLLPESQMEGIWWKWNKFSKLPIIPSNPTISYEIDWFYNKHLFWNWLICIYSANETAQRNSAIFEICTYTYSAYIFWSNLPSSLWHQICSPILNFIIFKSQGYLHQQNKQREHWSQSSCLCTSW